MSNQFAEALKKVGGQVAEVATAQEAAVYIAGRINGTVLLPPQSSLERAGLAAALEAEGVTVVKDSWHEHAPAAGAGVTAGQ